jgi:hypothetical protein
MLIVALPERRDPRRHYCALSLFEVTALIQKSETPLPLPLRHAGVARL